MGWFEHLVGGRALREVLPSIAVHVRTTGELVRLLEPARADVGTVYEVLAAAEQHWPGAAADGVDLLRMVRRLL